MKSKIFIFIVLLSIIAGFSAFSVMFGFRDNDGKTNNPTTNVVSFDNVVINCLGDSLTQGCLPDGSIMENPYPSLLQKELNCRKVNNYGIGGTPLSTYNENAMCVRYKNMDANADIISVMGGTNDALSLGTLDCKLGTPTDTDCSTYYGALDVLCRGLKEKCPNAFIFFMTPFALADNHDNYCMSNSGFTILDVRQAIYVVCTRYDIPVFDVYNQVNYKFIANQSVANGTGDGVHPNQSFINSFSLKLAQFIKDNYKK